MHLGRKNSMQRTGAGSGFPHPELRDEFCHHFISDLMGIESPHDFSESFLRVAPRLSNSAGLGKSPSILIWNKFPGDRRYWCWYYTLGEPLLWSNFFILYVRKIMPEIPIQFLTRGHTPSKWGNWGFDQNLIHSENMYEVPTLFWALC